MVRKNLKNFNYNKFIDFVNSIATGNSNTILSDKQIKKLYLFNFIPLMKIIKKQSQSNINYLIVFLS